jgi:LmbE family N-acetylglucosaminyl deacetylase
MGKNAPVLPSHDPKTLVFVHAHPDDEALLTAGTMARAAAEGHRVVLIVATDGSAGLTSPDVASEDLAALRKTELEVSAAILGVARTVHLGFPDSGLRGEVEGGFSSQDRFAIARRMAAVINEERADVVVGYDPSGGYGHPDHVQVHRTVRAAAVLANTPPRLFEATLPREPIARAVHAAARLKLTPKDFDAAEFDSAWTPSAVITHRVDVREQYDRKREALRAHASQATADGTTRTLAVLTRLPGPVGRLLLGTEYYVAVSDPSTRSSRSSAS